MNKPRLGGERQARAIRWVQYGVIALICLIGFLYAVHIAQTMGKYSVEYSPDEGNYIAMAKRLLNEHYYSYWGEGPDAYVSPGYPLVLTACMAIFGTDLEGIFCIKVVQGLLAAATVFLTFLLGYLLTEKYSVGLIACLLHGANTVFYLYSRLLLTETLYFFTLMLFFVVFVLAMKRERWFLHVLAGVCFAVTILVRPLLIVIAPFLFLPSLVRHWKDWKTFLRPLALFALGFLLLCLPWWVRNGVVLGEFIPLATQTNPMYAGLAPDVLALGLTDPGSLMGNFKLLLDLLRQDFFGTIYWMTFGKFQIIFMSTQWANPQVFADFLKDVAVYLGLFGGLRALFSKKYWGTALVFWVYLASSFLFIPVSRYSMQYLPLLGILAGYLLMEAFSHKHPGAKAHT